MTSGEPSLRDVLRVLEYLPDSGGLGVGVDAEDIARWAGSRLPGNQLLFSARERAYCESRAEPTQVYAGHWCAKEAVVKALARFVTVSPREVEIGHAPDGRPIATVSGIDQGAFDLEVSVSYTPHVAVAVAVAVAVQVGAG